jgi:putative hydrolase of the HAD superfamily
VRITGLAAPQLDSTYWAGRRAYDSGLLTGLEFWRKFARVTELNLEPAELEELNEWDARMWTTENPAMLAWQLALKRRGLLTAIVSNMGEAVYEHIQRELNWLSRFDVLVWSYQLRVTKPDPAIYRYVLEKLSTRPEETLFIDDRQVNVEAAIALGMKGVVFTTVEMLREDLIAQGLDGTVPLPG